MAGQEILDLVVVLKPEGAESMDASLESLKGLGLTVTSVDQDNGVVEGTCSAQKLADLRKLPIVAYARVDFDYIAETPEEVPEVEETGHNSDD